MHNPSIFMLPCQLALRLRAFFAFFSHNSESCFSEQRLELEPKFSCSRSISCSRHPFQPSSSNVGPSVTFVALAPLSYGGCVDL